MTLRKPTGMLYKLGERPHSGNRAVCPGCACCVRACGPMSGMCAMHTWMSEHVRPCRRAQSSDMSDGVRLVGTCRTLCEHECLSDAIRHYV